jgi:hypothetical protein
MIRMTCVALCMTAVAATAWAQEPAAAPAGEAPAATTSAMGDYNALRMDRVGSFKATFGQAVGIREMTGGVNITLLSDNPEVKALPMKAQTMSFKYRDGQTQPYLILMEGKVDIQHPQANVTSDRAEWNFETGDLIFTGSPVMNMPGVKDLRGSKITINLKNQTLDVADMTASEVDPNATGADSASSMPSDPSMLTAADVTDWAGLIETLKAQAAADAASPGKHIYGKLNPKLQEPLRSLSTSALVDQKGTLLKELNRLLSQPGLYNRDAWQGIALGEEADALIAKGALTTAEQYRQNRLILQAAYPNYIAAR